MANKKKRAAHAGAAPLHISMKLARLNSEDTARKTVRQGSPEAWIVRRVPVSLAAARVYAELHGIGGAP